MARRTRIVCTIGPASRSEAGVAALVAAGMDVARLNMSHGDREAHAEVFERVRRAAREAGRPVAVLLDLSGSKIRLGELAAPVDLAAGDEVTFTTEPGVAGEGFLLPVRYEGFADEIEAGDRFSMADGLVALEAIERLPRRVRARVLSPGRVSSHKGVNVPRGGMGLPALTEKDVADLRFGLALGVDWVAVSFVRSHRDAAPARAIMDEVGRRALLMAKLEKPQALEDLDAVLEAFDGVMVARGDLGVETEIENVPALQKRAIREANRRARPVVTATQMLLSMVTSPRPTRAEVSDVANAILDGSDAVMLSEETAMGARPAEAAAMLARIAERAEALARDPAPVAGRHPGLGSATENLAGDPAREASPERREPAVARAIAEAAVAIARSVGATLVVTPTAGGTTPRMVSAARPGVPILALSPREETVRALCMTHGVIPRVADWGGGEGAEERMREICRRMALSTGLARAGDRVLLTAGLPLDVPGATNALEVVEL